MEKLLRWVREKYEGYDGFARHLFAIGVGALVVGTALMLIIIFILALSPAVQIAITIFISIFVVSYVFGMLILE